MRIVLEGKRSESANSNRGQIHFQDEKSLQEFSGGVQFKDSEGAHSTDTRDMDELGAARFGSAWSGSRATTGMFGSHVFFRPLALAESTSSLSLPLDASSPCPTHLTTRLLAGPQA
jgi:hypothetical protein